VYQDAPVVLGLSEDEEEVELGGAALGGRGIPVETAAASAFVDTNAEAVIVLSDDDEDLL
jgi:hypothetical protein